MWCIWSSNSFSTVYPRGCEKALSLSQCLLGRGLDLPSPVSTWVTVRQPPLEPLLLVPPGPEPSTPSECDQACSIRLDIFTPAFPPNCYSIGVRDQVPRWLSTLRPMLALIILGLKKKFDISFLISPEPAPYQSHLYIIQLWTRKQHTNTNAFKEICFEPGIRYFILISASLSYLISNSITLEEKQTRKGDMSNFKVGIRKREPEDYHM